MKMKIFSCLLIGMLAVCTGDKETKENKESKDKRQIGIHQTRISPHQHIPDNEQLETVYGSHPSQYVIRAVGQGGQQHLQQYQPQQQITPSEPEQLQEVGPQQYSYIPESVQTQQGKGYSKQFTKKAQVQRPVQYISEMTQFANQYQDQPYQFISEEQILRLLQDELKQQTANTQENQLQQKPQKVPTQNSQQKQGLGSYRDTPVTGNDAPYSYSPQQYYNQEPLDYHRSVPHHPLAASSLEKELEKLVASNKPTAQYSEQVQHFKAPKSQPKIYSTTPVPDEKAFSFFPQLAQLSGFNVHQTAFLDQPIISQKISENQGQYLTEVTQPKQKVKPTSAPFQAKHQFYPSQQKSQSQYVSITEGKNAAVKVIDAPALQYEKPRIAQTPVNLYYRTSGPEAAKQSHLEPSRSSIFISQGTGIQRPSQVPQEIKPYSAEKVLRLPQDGKPISQEEFQALVDAGYPVQAVPVPVPVPYEKYVSEHSEYRQASEEVDTGLRRTKESRQGITYLHPVELRQEQEKRSQQKASS